MPIVSATSTSATSTSRPATAGVLKNQVARVVGAELEPPLQAAALEYLNNAIIDLNTKLYEANKVFRTTITLTNRQGTLPTQFYKEFECALVDSAGNRLRQLSYIDWAEHEHTFNFPTQLGSQGTFTGPMAYTLFNVYGEGVIRLLPFMSQTATPASTDYVAISYYKRFPILLSDGDVLDAPQEIQRALVLRAQADMLRIHNPASPALGMTQGLADRAWEDFGIIDRKHPDMHARIRLAPLIGGGWGYPGPDVVYIKI